MSIERLRPEIRELALTCEEHAYNWMLTYEPGAQDLLTDIPAMMVLYVQTAALLAADWYNDQNPESSYFAEPIDKIADERLENIATWVHGGPQRPENRMRTAANTMVFDAARNTIYQNAVNEGVAVVRYEYADSCNKCVARATTSRRAHNSRSDDLDREFHPSCEGMLVPVRRGVFEPPEYTRGWKERVRAAKSAGNTKPDDIANWIGTKYPAN